MPLLRRRPLLLPVLLCALAVLASRPTTAESEDDGSEAGARVARLYEEAATASREYEAGRKAADAQRGRAERAERLLARERWEITVLREDLGRIARAQYREGDGLPYSAQMLLAAGDDELMRGQAAAWRADLALGNAVGKSRRAEARLAADEAKARSARKALDQWNGELAAMKRTIAAKLDEARSTLQSRADASVAAGSCRGAVHLDGARTHSERKWVAPVPSYRLSARFGSGGERWANRHTGQDFAVPIGTPVRSVGAGRVVKVSCGGSFGIEIVIRHPGGYRTQYAHLAAVAVDQGDRVSTGQLIGQSGTSGNSTGPHLHFEVRISDELGSAIDPVPWLARHGVQL
ncbi:peptidoglycan DD-metalloendopeptidase family protein [Streptomyces sp. 142MFCol3.1]|uniref:peptidoglycan DD-metalloendopeptidase family protein n=1 Tax=Streptomyces sp. 142MFCol3.1 TaxID=1172179 RepID=UPI00040EC12B|nr:peptidoglycan DD-metalloendopeptidase family protein [Streptomyces sp. 142MFCol3.1]